jgi:hypothetical protein
MELHSIPNEDVGAIAISAQERLGALEQKSL